MQNRGEDQRDPQGPEHSAAPVSKEEQRNQDDGDNDDDVVVVILLAGIRPDCFFDHPPKQVVQPGDVGETGERFPDRRIGETIDDAEKRRYRETDNERDRAMSQGEDAQRKEKKRESV